jgi:hypothetical protein
MCLELDHLYICVKKKAPEIKILQNAGLELAPDTTSHTGQGTAAIFFNFENFYLELIWVENPDELNKFDKKLTEKFAMASNGGSPFGIGLHRHDPSDRPLPFKTNSYYAEWMKPGSSIDNAEIEHINQPEIFVVAPYMNWSQAIKDYPKLLETTKHQAGMRQLTRLIISGPEIPGESEAMRVLDEQRIVEFKSAKEHLAELVFDNAGEGKSIDCRPVLPLLIYY